MLSGLASLLGIATASDTPFAAFDARERLRRLCDYDEVKVLYLFAHGNLSRDAFVEAGASLLGSHEAAAITSLGALFDEAAVESSLSYASLRQALERPPLMTSPTGSKGSPPRARSSSGRSGSPTSAGQAASRPTDIFEGAGELIDRQAFRLAMLRLGLRAAPQEIDALFDAVDVAHTGTVKRGSLLELLRRGQLAPSVRDGAETRHVQPVPKLSSAGMQQQSLPRGASPRRAPLAAMQPAGLTLEDMQAQAAAAAARAEAARAAAAARVAERRAASPRKHSPRSHSPRSQSPRGGNRSPRCGGVWCQGSPPNQQPAAAPPQQQYSSWPGASAGGQRGAQPGARRAASPRGPASAVPTPASAPAGTEPMLALAPAPAQVSVTGGRVPPRPGSPRASTSQRASSPRLARSAPASASSTCVSSRTGNRGESPQRSPKPGEATKTVPIGPRGPDLWIPVGDCKSAEEMSAPSTASEAAHQAPTPSVDKGSATGTGLSPTRGDPRRDPSSNVITIIPHPSQALSQLTKPTPVATPASPTGLATNGMSPTGGDGGMPLGFPHSPQTPPAPPQASAHEVVSQSAGVSPTPSPGISAPVPSPGVSVCAPSPGYLLHADQQSRRTHIGAQPSPMIAPRGCISGGQAVVPRSASAPRERPSRERPTRERSTPQSRLRHARDQLKLAQALDFPSHLPGPGAYDPESVASFGRSSRRQDDERASPWARSTSARMPPDVPSASGDSAFAYNPVCGTVASRAAAASSPSMQSQRGRGIHSSNPQQRLARLPFNQGVTHSSQPGPGYYDSVTEGTIAKALLDKQKKGLASTSFRSSTAQHNPPAPASQSVGPAPGSYDTEPKSTNRTGDMTRILFASKQERFSPHETRGTDANVGPGTYQPGKSTAEVQEDRLSGGKEGARSFPFNSTDRRYRTGKTGPGELDVYVSHDGRVYQ